MGGISFCSERGCSEPGGTDGSRAVAIVVAHVPEKGAHAKYQVYLWGRSKCALDR